MTTNSLSTSWMHICSQAPIVASRVQHSTLNKHLGIKIGYQKIGHQFTPIMAGYITAMFTMNSCEVLPRSSCSFIDLALLGRDIVNCDKKHFGV